MVNTDGHFVVFLIALLNSLILSRFSIAENVVCKDDKGISVDWYKFKAIDLNLSQSED